MKIHDGRLRSSTRSLVTPSKPVGYVAVESKMINAQHAASKIKECM